MAIYQIRGQSIHADDPGLPELLASIYSARERPLCLCRIPGVEMYVAKVDEKYLIKRMPNSGSDHAPACDSYEPPPELSGLGQVIGSAIQENPDEGTTALKFDFALSKGASRSAPAPSGKETDSVKTDGNKLTLRGTLHYLWEEAGFNRWAPTMAGKRSWYVIRKYLLQAVEDKTAKGASLAGMLYIPESFNAEKKNEITQRRLAQMMRIATPEKGTRRLMLVVGEVKEIGPSRYGHKIVLKHLPDCHFMMNDDIHKRLLKRFEVELGLWDALEGTHLMMIGTFSIGATGVASLEEIALMCVTENWIPFESTFEKMVLDALTQQNRRFMKGMRYNLPSTRPLACAVASDTEPEPTAMYVVPPGASEDYAAAVDELIAESKLPSWKWEAGEAPMPPLPALPEHGRC
ncbi:hypothetical protein R20233_04843 [Ralstonia sp. LMG 32965]|uniref:DUF1173 domain-containing protein n=1 Tax=Ralstonia flatus TaxID=3058601 RepID=UPI0028F59527|nr:DUF1173 domain-containing protein [Ralstonia sp. LMG 32965]CAJ0902845.1 hypothetical protein R20233_04843 [Ralstonia sp. LMG 32965]